MEFHSKDIAAGVFLALAVYVTIFSSVAPVTQTAYAQSTPIFSIVLLAPTSNSVRTQYASIIANSYQSVGIDAKVFYVNFDQLINRMFFATPQFFNTFPNGTVNYASINWNAVVAANSFSKGGYDAGFLGWIAFSPSPDSAFGNYIGNYANWGYNGDNYYLYNNSQVNQLINQIESTTNTSVQVPAMWQLQEILQNTTPSAIIYHEEQIVARSPSITDYGSSSLYSPFAFPDIQHIGNVTTLNFAEAGNVFPDGNLNPATTSASNSLYVTYITAPLFSSLMEINPHTNNYYLALAKSVTSTNNGLNWTIVFHNNKWADSAPVTANDFVYTFQSLFDPNTASVNLGSMLVQLGNTGYFTYGPQISNVASYADGNNVSNGNTVVIDNANGAPAVPFYVKYINATAFQVDLTKPYAFMNLTWTAIAPLPMHYFGTYAPSTWNSLAWSAATQIKDFTWNTTEFGGNGSYTGYAFGNGPYVMTGFSFTSNTANEVKNPNFWNASGLTSIGQYSVTNYNVVWIGSIEAAIAAYKLGTVNQLDAEFGLAKYVSTLQGLGANVITAPGALYQELGFNMQNPIWGTGVATPNGQKDPTHAAQYAADVRRAMSYLIPRDLIIQNLLNGAGTPGITPWSSIYGQFYNPNLKPDPYDPAMAEQLLSDAGYSNFAPIAGGGSYQPPSTGNVQVPSFLLGNSLTLTGTFSVPSSAALSSGGGFAVVLEQSTDNGGNWTPVMFTTTNTGGYYTLAYTPTVTGSVMYRVFFTGIPDTTVQASQFNDPAAVEGSLTTYYAINTTNTAYSPTTTLQIGSLASVVGQLTNSTNALSAQISSLQAQVQSMAYVGYGAIVIALIAIVVAVLVGRRKPTVTT